MNEEVKLLRDQLKKVQEENDLLHDKIGELEHDLKDAVDINEKKNSLISQISHEIRTPLNVVIGMADNAKEELNNPNKVKDNLSEIANSSRILLEIVDNILDVADLAGGKLVVDSNKFDLKEQITSLGMHFYERAKYQNVHFDIHIKGVSGEYLIGDERRLQQILTNLFNHELRFTPSGGKIELTVLQGSSSGNRVHMRFIIQDTGSGLPVSVTDELFLPYEEKQNIDKHMYTDLGVSLFITRQLIIALGGTISVDSHSGEGSQIIVDIPFEKTEQQGMNISGMNGHIAKPVDIRLLYKTLNKRFQGFDDEEMANQLLKRAEKLEKQNTKLKEQAEHDPLTGLYNRYAYEKEIYSLMCRKEPVGFLLMDIDYFKEINDVYGHAVGDEVLKKVANTLKSSVRESDFIVRLGGDEFAIILKKYGDNPQLLYDKVVNINQKLLHSTDGIPGVTLSVGAAFSDIGYTTELFGNADKALYKTKQNGRNGCTIFDENNRSEYDELAKGRHNLSEYLNFSFDGRSNMGEMISVLAYRLLEYSLKVRLENMYGANKQKELFREAGFEAGVYLAEEILDKSLKFDSFMKQLADTMKELKVGNFVLDQMDEITGKAVLSVYEDADCSGLTAMGETVCQYDEGMIAGILSVYTSQKYRATETKCWAKGDQVCRFEAEPFYKLS